VESNLLSEPCLNKEIGYTKDIKTRSIFLLGQIRTIYAVAIQFKSGIIQDKIDPATRLGAKYFHSFPELAEMVTEDIFLGRCEMVATCRLERFYLVLGHVD
jgi:hypothetical protein